MWIAREWSTAVQALARSFPAVLLTGPRQVGKTSLLRHLYPEFDYATFDDPALARQAETQPGTFFDQRSEPLILDEVQYVPSIFRTLKLRIDKARRPGRYFLTGSQTFALMENVSESLAGRCGVLPMSSLGFREIKAALPEAVDLDVLVRGGFPELYAGPFERPSDWYSSYLATYLERDVRNMRGVGDLRDFDRFLRAAALRTGQLLSYADLARDVGIAPNTAKAWMSVLVSSGQIFLLEPYHRSLGKRLIKSPKLYFLDSGLACYLVGISDSASLLASPLAGPLWETFVIGQVVRHFQVARVHPPVWFWRTQYGDEVDLLIERGGRFIAIECKIAQIPSSGADKGLQALEAMYGARSIEQSYLVCRTTHGHKLGGGTKTKVVNSMELLAALPRG